MIIKPEQIVFESTNDIVDYVSKGLVPSRKNFEKVMHAVRCPVPYDSTGEENVVIINQRLFMNCDNNTVEEVLTQVYKNRVRNRNITLAAGGIILAALLVKGHNDSKNKDYDKPCDFTSCPFTLD